jgi:hypothetical protein
MQHVYWAGGHVLMFFTGLRYLLAWVVFKSGGLGYWYKGRYPQFEMDALVSPLSYPVLTRDCSLQLHS